MKQEEFIGALIFEGRSYRIGIIVHISALYAFQLDEKVVFTFTGDQFIHIAAGREQGGFCSELLIIGAA